MTGWSRSAARLCDRAEALGITGRPIFWQRDRRRILNDLGLFLVEDSRHRRTHGTSPLAAELAFGFDGGLAAVEVPLPDGRVLRVRGRIDRVDRGADGTVHVTDYKTGSTYGYGDLDQGDPVAAGTKLQLPIYGLAGRRTGDPTQPCGPSTGSSPAGAASTGSATRSPRRCSSAPARSSR